jgi:ribosomal silencing factor RsfS
MTYQKKEMKSFLKYYEQDEELIFFDVRSTKAEDYITITRKNLLKKTDRFILKNTKFISAKKILAAFQEILNEMTSFVLNNKGEEVISEKKHVILKEI